MFTVFVDLWHSVPVVHIPVVHTPVVHTPVAHIPVVHSCYSADNQQENSSDLRLGTETTLSLQRTLQLLQSCQSAHPVQMHK